jgi:hypothetical protein
VLCAPASSRQKSLPVRRGCRVLRIMSAPRNNETLHARLVIRPGVRAPHAPPRAHTIQNLEALLCEARDAELYDDGTTMYSSAATNYAHAARRRSLQGNTAESSRVPNART